MSRRTRLPLRARKRSHLPPPHEIGNRRLRTRNVLVLDRRLDGAPEWILAVLGDEDGRPLGTKGTLVKGRPIADVPEAAEAEVDDPLSADIARVSMAVDEHLDLLGIGEREPHTLEQQHHPAARGLDHREPDRGAVLARQVVVIQKEIPPEKRLGDPDVVQELGVESLEIKGERAHVMPPKGLERIQISCRPLPPRELKVQIKLFT